MQIRIFLNLVFPTNKYVWKDVSTISTVYIFWVDLIRKNIYKFLLVVSTQSVYCLIEPQHLFFKKLWSLFLRVQNVLKYILKLGLGEKNKMQ